MRACTTDKANERRQVNKQIFAHLLHLLGGGRPESIENKAKGGVQSGATYIDPGENQDHNARTKTYRV